MLGQPYQHLDKQFINGQWREGQSTRKVININPFTQDIIFNATAASQLDVDEAFNSAQNAFKSFSKSTADERKALVDKVHTIINQRYDEIIDWLIQESGSTRLKANIEVRAALNIVKESATFPDRMEHIDLPNPEGLNSRAYRQALGVIGVISPWNFPFHLTMRSVVTALAIGNTVVIKPASDTMVTGGTLIAKIFEEAGFPAGTINVVAGAGSEIGDYFVTHAVPKLISFTGSTEVGKRVGQLAVSGPYLKRIALELGGNAPLLVLDDANLDMAVELTVMGRFLHQGQICMSTNRVIVDEKIHDAFVDKLLKRLDSVVVGNPADEGTLIGPIINAQQTQHIISIIENAKGSGAMLAYGKAINGNLVPPHIFINVSPNSDLAQQESFGPVLPIIKSSGDANAIELANSTQYGLASAICTSDTARGLQLALQIDAGMTHVNGITVADQSNAPFGGEKNSGLGRFNGQWVLEEFSRTHWITVH